MPTLNYQDIYIDCDTAIKGEDYIHLLDENGVLIACFDGISDFSGFTLENGSYVDPTEDHDCYIAVIRDDGTIGKGAVRSINGILPDENGNVTIPDGDEVSY